MTTPAPTTTPTTLAGNTDKPPRPVRVPVSPQSKRKVSRCEGSQENNNNKDGVGGEALPANKRAAAPETTAPPETAQTQHNTRPGSPSPLLSPLCGRNAGFSNNNVNPNTITLVDLPPELILHVASYLPEPPLNNLIRTCRPMHSLLTHSLYRLGRQIEYSDQHRLLHWAVHRGYYNTTLYILAAGADPNAPCHPRGHHPLQVDGLTPLHIAVSRHHRRIVRLLLSNGAKTKCWDKDGNTPLHLAVSIGNHGVLRDLIRAGAKLTSRDSSGQRPLHLAVLKGDRVAVRMLLSAGASVNPVDHTGGTVLHVAAGLSGVGIVQQLLDAGVNINGKDKEGMTPLHWAAWTGGMEVVSRLVKHGAEVDSIDDAGKSPLHWAAEGEDEASWLFLIKKGADRNREDKTGTKPVMWKKVGAGKKP